jgi:hypothetical protein
LARLLFSHDPICPREKFSRRATKTAKKTFFPFPFASFAPLRALLFSHDPIRLSENPLAKPPRPPRKILYPFAPLSALLFSHDPIRLSENPLAKPPRPPRKILYPFAPFAPLRAIYSLMIQYA